MKRITQWLRDKGIIAVLLSIALYLAIVTFHDEITLLAIRVRNSLGRARYNDYIAYFFFSLLLATLAVFTYYILKGRQKILKSILAVIIASITVLSFRYLMTYNIEAIHFVEYMLVAIILVPALKNYGETVFWVTIAGILDELFQYIILTPEFEYFDFNDCILNLVGAGAGAFLVFISAGENIDIRKRKWWASPAVITGIGLLDVFILLLISGKITINPIETSGTGSWFSLNRAPMPDDFWVEPYPGRKFHILKPAESIFLFYLLFTSFFFLDFYITKTDVFQAKKRMSQ